MKKKKIMNPFLAATLAFFMAAGCGNSGNGANADTGDASAEAAGTSASVAESESAATESTMESESIATENTEVSESTAAEEVADATETADDSQTAEQLLVDLTGTYQELWPVILSDEYEKLWIDNCGELVGEENAKAAYEKLASMVSGEIYGEKAVEAYTDGNGVYDCSFTQGVDTLEFDGDSSMIKGYDKDGKELFAHTYHYVGMEKIRGLYEYESDDADSGEFTYFCIAPDTSDTTYHIELRYGSDLDALGQYDAGDYAYWLASGISTDYDQTMIENCIQLFCTENLSE